MVVTRLYNYRMFLIWFLVFFTNLALSTQKEDMSGYNSIEDQSLINFHRDDPIDIKPLTIPEQKYNQNSENYPSHQLPEMQKEPSQKTLKMEQWVLESSIKNAPRLIKGILVYLHTRIHHQRSYSVRIPSLHRFILVGPPGSGKTTMAYAIAYKLNYPVVFIGASALLGRFRNQTAKNIQHFLQVCTADQRAKVIIIDELNKLFELHTNESADDSQNAAAFWLALDNIEKENPNVIIIATANNVDKLPPEIKSRFSGKIISIPMPTQEQKIQAFKDHIMNDKSVTLDPEIDDHDILKIINQIKDCSLRNVQFLIDTAKIFYYSDKSIDVNKMPIILTKKHFEQALKQLQVESKILHKSSSDLFFKTIRDWGLIFSMAVNIITLMKESERFFKT